MYINTTANGKRSADEWHPFMAVRGETEPQLAMEEKKQGIMKPTSSKCYERDVWRPFMTKHGEHEIGSNRFEETAEYELKNEKHDHRAWVVIGGGVLSWYHKEDNRRLSNKWRPFKTGLCDSTHIGQHLLEGQQIEWEDEIQSRFGRYENQDSSNRTITDALDLATMPIMVTLATLRPLERLKKRRKFQSTPTHIHLIAYDKQFSGKWQTLTTNRNMRYLYRLEKVDGKQEQIEPSRGWCYEWDEWRLFITKDDKPMDCPHWFKEKAKYCWENEKREHKTWVVIDFLALNSYHEENDRLFAKEWRSFMTEHDELVHTDLHRVKNKKKQRGDEMKYTFDQCEEQNDRDRTIIDTLDLAITSTAVTYPLERIEERWTFQSMPMYKNLILYGKQFPGEWKSFKTKNDTNISDLYRLDEVDEAQDNYEKPSHIFYHGEDLKPFSDKWWPFEMEQDEITTSPLQFEKDIEDEWRNKKQNEINLAWNQNQDEHEHKWFLGEWQQPFVTKQGEPNYYDLNCVVQENEDKEKWEKKTKSLLSWDADKNGCDGTITDALDLATIPMGARLAMLCPLELIEDRWTFQSMPMHMNLIIYGKQFSDEWRPFYEPILDLLQAETRRKKEKDEKQDENEFLSFSCGNKNNGNKMITLRTIAESVNSGNGRKTRRSTSKRTNTIARGLKSVLRNVIF